MAAKAPKTPAATPPHRTRADGERSRAAILHEAARLATVDGLDGLSLAHLANAVGMSKSGLFAHFRSKQELQLATVETASAIFDEQVINPAGAASPGLARLKAYVERFLGHVEEGVFPGGCFFVSAVSEFDSHPGPVRDGAMAFSQRWLGLLADEVTAAQTAGELDSRADPAQIAFELNAYMVLGNMQFVATADPSALDRVRRAVENLPSRARARHSKQARTGEPTNTRPRIASGAAQALG